jgi:hypothetical protein
MKGFSPKWCQWVESMVIGRSVGININDEVGLYFQPNEGSDRGILCHRLV